MGVGAVVRSTEASVGVETLVGRAETAVSGVGQRHAQVSATGGEAGQACGGVVVDRWQGVDQRQASVGRVRAQAGVDGETDADATGVAAFRDALDAVRRARQPIDGLWTESRAEMHEQENGVDWRDQSARTWSETASESGAPR